MDLKEVDFRTGNFKAFYDTSSGRKHKKFPLEGTFEVGINDFARPVATLRDIHGTILFTGTWYRETRFKLFEENGFTFDKWDIRCEDPLEEERTPPPPSKLAFGKFTPASKLVRHPYAHQTRFNKPLLSMVNLKPMKSRDGYFKNYKQKLEELDRRTGDDYEHLVAQCNAIQCQQCFIVTVGADDHDCPKKSEDDDVRDLDFKKSLLWHKSVCEKTVIPKSRLIEIFQAYSNEPAYIAAVFDGFILGGHYLDGIHDVQFDNLRTFMKQL